MVIQDVEGSDSDTDSLENLDNVQPIDNPVLNGDIPASVLTGKRLQIEEVESSDEDDDEEVVETKHEEQTNNVSNTLKIDQPKDKDDKNGHNDVEKDTNKFVTNPVDSQKSELNTEESSKTDKDLTKVAETTDNENSGETSQKMETDAERSEIKENEPPLAPVVVEPPPLPPGVARLKEKGNELFKAGQYGEAINQYQLAINILKDGESVTYI